MAHQSTLYMRCKAVYDKLRHRVIGEHGQSRRTHDSKEGDIIGAFMPRQLLPVMTLNTDRDPAKRYFAIEMPGKTLEVHVYADPSAWPHGQSVSGATTEEVVVFLGAIERRLQRGPQTPPTPRYK